MFDCIRKKSDIIENICFEFEQIFKGLIYCILLSFLYLIEIQI